MHSAICTALKLPMLSPVWVNSPRSPSSCRLVGGFSSFLFFSLIILLDLQTAVPKEPEVYEGPEMPRRSRRRDRELSMLKARSLPVKKVKSPPAKKGKSSSSSDTASKPIEIIDGEPSPELKQLLIKHMIGRVVLKKP